MPNDKDHQPFWTFTNFLALVIVIIGFSYLAYSTFYLSKAEVKDNTLLTQTTTNVSNFMMVVITFFFGSSVLSALQNKQMSAMQKDATDIALSSANSNNPQSPGAVQNKVDKAVAIQELQNELNGDPPPNQERINEILEEIKRLEKRS